MPGGEANNGGRVTTQQFYQALLDTNAKIAASDKKQSEERAEMEVRLMNKWSGVPTQVQNNKEEIATLRRRSDIVDTIEGLIGIAVAIFFGTRK